ncbi:MAG: cation-translocating P-type ATPase [Nitrosospira multiformis]|nr:cation-translocating P-type ATPase [Nitrosospira multiformis]
MDKPPGVDSLTGLTRDEAARRLAENGYNELPSAKPRNVLAIAISVAREPMFILLIACGTTYLLLGSKQEALMLLGFVFVVMGITFVQERKTERALGALRDLSSPRALVIRGGKQERIPGREVVRGDLIILSEGDRVPADAILLESAHMSIDESVLTGESVPVRKRASDGHPQEMNAPGGNDLPFIFSSTLVVQGKGMAVVTGTATDTAIGRIGKALASIEQKPTRLQGEVARVVKRVSWIGFALASIVALWYGATRGDWLNGFLAGLTLAMALLPEELPVVLTIFLGLGAWRISKEKVLTRQIPAIEMLGAATVLCVDKTGTLTQNRMAVARIFSAGQIFDAAGKESSGLPETFHETLEFAVLASHRAPFDPMEIAIRNAGHKLLADTEHLHSDWRLMSEYPLSHDLLAMSRVWQSPDRVNYIIAAKGSPEAIIDLCHLEADSARGIITQVNNLAEQGLRVLGVAKAEFNQQPLPDLQHDFTFQFLGLIALADPIRPQVPAAIEESRAAGLRVIMITGDYPATAMNIARQIGIQSPENTISGSMLDSLSDAELQERIRAVNIFCRVVPEQKLRIVNALKASDEVVVMTGDGVNDAPALKSADIGIAMGKRGTDVARESAALVLLNDDFSSIISAVRLGRRIFDNLQKASAFIIAVHLPIVGLSVIPVMMGLPVILMPVHILFLELIIDPACSIVFEAEPEEEDIMRRPPRSPDTPLFDRDLLILGFGQGLVLLLIVQAIFSFALYRGLGADEARAITFMTLVIASVGLIFTNRSRSRSALASLESRNAALWWVTGGAMGGLGLVAFVPALSELFSFGRLKLAEVAFCLFAGLVTFGLFETMKLIRARRQVSS